MSHVLADLGYGVRASPLIDRSAIDGMDSAQDFVRFGTEMDRSIAALTCGRFSDAERIAMSAFEQAIRYGLEARQGPHLRGCLIDAMFELGRYADAEAIMQQMHQGEGIPHSLNWLGATMSRVAIAQG